MKTVIDMAREAGLPEAWISDTGVLKWSDLERFAELARADEREACAQLSEMAEPYKAADLIRARSNT